MRSVDKNFREIFKELTNGDASLQLEDQLNIESGLLVQASPGGKNLLNIDAMSGGEKTLTALAFLFAIQRYKPSPIYILDEVDSNLDKINSKKIAEFVAKSSKNAQFLLVTHNDTTITTADRIIGVHMDEKKISRIVGVKLAEAD